MNAVSIAQLTKIYKNGTQALKGVSLEVKEGDFFALLGANGAGKTTLIGILTSVVNKSSGDLKVFGLDLDRHSDRVKKMIGVAPQEFNFNIFEKVLDIVVSQAGYFGIPRRRALNEAERILKNLDLWDKRHQVSRTLSGGMKRRLLIARALIHRPRLLILDEPTAGVDVELRHGMWVYLKQLNKAGTTILLTTHYLEEAEHLCRHVGIIKQGEIIKQESVKRMLASLEKESYIVDLDHYKGEEQVGPFILRPVDATSAEVDLHKKDTVADLVHALEKEQIVLKSLRPKGNRLEQLFLNLLKD